MVAVGCRLSAIGYRLSAIGYRLSAIGYRLSAIGYRLSAIGYRLSAIGYRLSAIGYRLSAIGYRLSRPIDTSCVFLMQGLERSRERFVGTGRENVGDFTKLAVWQCGHELVLAIYQATSRFPSDERFALSIQLRRAAISITSNVAEGCGRNTPREMAHFVRIALGSANEVQNQTLVARDLGYVSAEQWRSMEAKIQRVKRMLSGLERSVRGAASI